MFLVPDLEMTHIHQLYSSFNGKNVITQLYLRVIEAGQSRVCLGIHLPATNLLYEKRKQQTNFSLYLVACSTNGLYIPFRHKWQTQYFHWLEHSCVATATYNRDWEIQPVVWAAVSPVNEKHTHSSNNKKKENWGSSFPHSHSKCTNQRIL